MTTTADVITLPVSEQTAADVLDAMAERDAPLFEVRPWAHPSLSPEQLATAWADYCEQVSIRDGLMDTGREPFIEWSEVYDPDDLGHPRDEEAIAMKCAEADEARAVIQFGYRGVTP